VGNNGVLYLDVLGKYVEPGVPLVGPFPTVPDIGFIQPGQPVLPGDPIPHGETCESNCNDDNMKYIALMLAYTDMPTYEEWNRLARGVEIYANSLLRECCIKIKVFRWALLPKVREFRDPYSGVDAIFLMLKTRQLPQPIPVPGGGDLEYVDLKYLAKYNHHDLRDATLTQYLGDNPRSPHAYVAASLLDFAQAPQNTTKLQSGDGSGQLTIFTNEAILKALNGYIEGLGCSIQIDYGTPVDGIE
jgi:hypothetical protein